MKQAIRKVLMPVFLLCATAAPACALDGAQYLTQLLAQPTVQIGQTTVAATELQKFYASKDYQPVWLDAHGLTPRAMGALALMAQAGDDGLDPETYAVSSIRAFAAQPFTDREGAMRTRIALDVLMSQAVMHYASDLQNGAMRHQWDTGKSALTAEERLALLTQAAATPDTAGFLQALAPAQPGYAAVKAALHRYNLIAQNGGWPQFIPGQKIKPGMADARLAAIRQILIINGDMAAGAAAAVNTYDDLAIAGIKNFQERHGLEPDGVIGEATQRALAVPVSERIAQLAMSLERMRWLPHDLGARYVMVNIPAYQLTAVAGDSQLNMNVIVGKPATKTPMFSKAITNVVFNPSWGVPSKIAVNEILPKLQKNPNYLIESGYTVTENRDGISQVVDPQEIDWQTVGRGNFAYSFRQNPGDGNALGKVKFNIPNSDDIYLHDTAQHGLFVRAERSLSHGCVRLADPKALTRFVMRNEGWTDDKIDSTYDSDVPKTVRITPLPVYLVYWTGWADAAGRAHFNRDVYGMDKTLFVSKAVPAG